MANTKSTQSEELTLEKQRGSINTFKAKIATVSNAGLPPDEVENQLLDSLIELKMGYNDLIGRAATQMASGEAINVSTLLNNVSRPETLARLALGGVVAAIGVHRVMADVKQLAGGPPSNFRMTAQSATTSFRNSKKRFTVWSFSKK